MASDRYHSVGERGPRGQIHRRTCPPHQSAQSWGDEFVDKDVSRRYVFVPEIASKQHFSYRKERDLLNSHCVCTGGPPLPESLGIDGGPTAVVVSESGEAARESTDNLFIEVRTVFQT